MLEVMISKKKARKNRASKNKPKKSGKVNKETPSWYYDPTETKIVKKLPKAPKKIRDKMARACERIPKEIRKHREYETCQLPVVHVIDYTHASPMSYYARKYVAAVWATFWRDGRIVTENSCSFNLEDYDHPGITTEGHKYLKKVAHDAAKAEKLRIGRRTYIVVDAMDKGGCEIGYCHITYGDPKTDIIKVPFKPE